MNRIWHIRYMNCLLIKNSLKELLKGDLTMLEHSHGRSALLKPLKSIISSLNKNKDIVKYSGVTATLFFILAFILFSKLLEKSYPLGSDSMGLITELSMMKKYSSFFSTWRAFTSLGHATYPSPLLNAFYAITVGGLNVAPAILAKFLLIFSFWLAEFSIYICAVYLTKNFVSGVIASTIYSFNPVFISQIAEGHYTLAMGYSFFPILFLVYDKAFRVGNTQSLLLLPIVFLIFGTTAHPHVVYATILFLLCYTAIYSALRMKKVLVIRAIIALPTMLVAILPFIFARYLGHPMMYIYIIRLSGRIFIVIVMLLNLFYYTQKKA